MDHTGIGAIRTRCSPRTCGATSLADGAAMPRVRHGVPDNRHPQRPIADRDGHRLVRRPTGGPLHSGRWRPAIRRCRDARNSYLLPPFQNLRTAACPDVSEALTHDWRRRSRWSYPLGRTSVRECFWHGSMISIGRRKSTWTTPEKTSGRCRRASAIRSPAAHRPPAALPDPRSGPRQLAGSVLKRPVTLCDRSSS